MGNGAELFDNEDVEHVCHLTPAFPQMDATAQARLRTRVNHVLQSRPTAAYTFSINQLQGTPSWIVFDGDYTILAQWFGHKSETEVDSIIARALQTTSMMSA